MRGGRPISPPRVWGGSLFIPQDAERGSYPRQEQAECHPDPCYSAAVLISEDPGNCSEKPRKPFPTSGLTASEPAAVLPTRSGTTVSSSYTLSRFPHLLSPGQRQHRIRGRRVAHETAGVGRGI